MLDREGRADTGASLSGWRRVTALGLGAVLVLSLVQLGSPTRAAESPLAPVEPSVLVPVEAKGQTTFWAVLRARADLSPARSLLDRDERGRFVVDRLRATANATQARLLGLLSRRGVAHESFWIVNAIRVTADEALRREVAAQPEVAEVVDDKEFRVPEPDPGTSEPTVGTVEWNVARVRAPEVWSSFGVRGEAIVVANIDTGVRFDHPVLVRQYRGARGDGTFDHNYSWFDPSRVCGSPSLAPCDNNGHGTHVMGTMVGEDAGLTNQVGVAPRARWIAAKGCESGSCSFSALLASGQWILAPTDLNGQNPRADLRPHVVNNSWGGSGGQTFYQDVVNAWVASGIFPAFSNGNSGPSCGRSGSPGDYVNSYSAGAFGSDNAIASFSSRGPSAFGPGELKPNLAAPGVNVRSAWNDGGYRTISGTSMASPHVAATVALMWSAAPALERQINETRRLLDDGAIDVEALGCGGTADDNNVWGEGRIDAFVAVDTAPRGPTGTLAGTVTDATTGAAISGATIRAEGPTVRSVTTSANGTYSVVLSTGTYTVTASSFGYVSGSASLEIADGQTTAQDFALAPAPRHAVSGHVRDDAGLALARATVTVVGTPLAPAITDDNGAYAFASVPEGTYDLRAQGGRCHGAQTQPLVVDGPETLDFALLQRSDGFGYFCRLESAAYVEAANALPLTGDDASTAVTLPFSFTFYGQTYTTANVSTNGLVNFLAPDSSFSNHAIPNTAVPNAAVYAFWDDLLVDSAASVRTELLGTAPDRRFVIEWRNVRFFDDSSRRVDFEVILSEKARILTQYRNIAADGRERGSSATIGLENEIGTVAFQFSANEAAVESPQLAVLYRLPPSAFVLGRVTDANDGFAVAGATVRALQGGTEVWRTKTDGDGRYRMHLRLGAYTIEASRANYSTEASPLALATEDAFLGQDFVLRTARAAVEPAALEIIAPAGETRARTLTLANSGGLEMSWLLRERGGGSVGGEGLWLEKTDKGIAVEENTGSGELALPSAFEWTPDTASAPLAVLVYADDPYHPAPDTYVDLSLRRLGLKYTAYYNGSFSSFETTLKAGGWDVVIFANDNFAPPVSTLDALNAHVQGGGRLVIHSWRVGATSAHALWAGLGASFVANDGDPPDPVRWWDPTHAAFIEPEEAPEPTLLQRGRYGTYGQRVNPLSGSEAIAGYTAGVAPGEAAMIVGNADRTVFKGFTDGQNDADLDADLVRDGVELWTNLVVGMAQGFYSDVPWLAAEPTSGSLASAASQTVRITVNAAGLAPGVYRADVVVRCNCGRRPSVAIPVTLIVPAYFQGGNAGGRIYVDSLGDTWAPDREYAAGGWGYMNARANTARTTRDISGTEDDPLYQDLRNDPLEYRFDGLPSGVYEVDLRFAELRERKPETRIFDVIIEGQLLLPAHDIAYEVGSFAADTHVFFVPVTDGQLNIRFVVRRGYGLPIVNGIQVIHRPDRAP